ncbi:hypothetical protein ACFVT5_14485 [Streptomyces sp. NPDC058001]|uniref:hypothetical protein n=1 Tax=Streptomyces sp. NPDC058001 TaxID=3346300 RepID=UPI0036E97C2D
MTVMVLVMLTDASFWELLAFDGIGDVDVEAVTAAFGTVKVVARGRAPGAECPDCGSSRTGCTTAISAG